MSDNISNESCSAIGCKSKRKTCPGKRFYRFPTDKARCKVWIQHCRRADWLRKPVSGFRSYVLCGDHFETSQFCDIATKRRLIPTGIPTLFPNLPNPPARITSSRKPPKPREFLQTPKKLKVVPPVPTSTASTDAKANPSTSVSDLGTTTIFLAVQKPTSDVSQELTQSNIELRRLKSHVMSIEGKIAIIKQHIAAIPDYPKPGILFRDIFPVLRRADVFGYLIDVFIDHIEKHYKNIHVIVGLEARGFLIGPAVALRLGCAFVPVRKAGKLPGKVVDISYQLEYGEDKFEMQSDSITPGQNVVIIDDLLATGGTMHAACSLVEQLQGKVVGCIVVIELPVLGGKEKVPAEFHSFVKF